MHVAARRGAKRPKATLALTQLADRHRQALLRLLLNGAHHVCHALHHAAHGGAHDGGGVALVTTVVAAAMAADAVMLESFPCG